MGLSIYELVSQLVGIRCEVAQNPYGSILSLDFGPLSLRPDDPPGAKPHGWRHLTISAPWRVETDDEVLFDWNVTGGTRGLLPSLVAGFIGQRVISAATAAPAWDLTIVLENGWRLKVFGDCDDERDEAWFILGTDGAEAVARPHLRTLPTSATG